MARSRRGRACLCRGRRIAAAVAAAVQLVEPLDPVEHVLDGPYLRSGERPHLRGGQPQRIGLLGGVAVAQQPGRGVHGDPGEQGGQVREVVVHRRGRHRRSGAVPAGGALGGQVVAPRGDLAGSDGGDPVVPVPGREPGGEPVQVPGDLPRHLIGPHAPHRQIEVPLSPGAETVAGLTETNVKINYLS